MPGRRLKPKDRIANRFAGYRVKIDTASTPANRVSHASDLVRAVLNDLPPERAERIAEEVSDYLFKVSARAHANFTGPKGKGVLR